MDIRLGPLLANNIGILSKLDENQFFGRSEPLKSTLCFREYMSYKLQNINFIVEHKELGSHLFLDVKICPKNGKFFSSFYRKPTFSGFFTKYEIYITSSELQDMF